MLVFRGRDGLACAQFLEPVGQLFLFQGLCDGCGFRHRLGFDLCQPVRCVGGRFEGGLLVFLGQDGFLYMQLLEPVGQISLLWRCYGCLCDPFPSVIDNEVRQAGFLGGHRQRWLYVCGCRSAFGVQTLQPVR